MFCTSCGAQLPDETRFCTQCGMPVEGAPQEESPTAPEAAPAPAPAAAPAAASSPVPAEEPAPTPEPTPAPSTAPAAPSTPSPAPAAPSSSSETQTPKKSNGKLIAIIVVAAVVIVAAIVVLFALRPSNAPSETQKPAGTVTIEEETTQEAADDTPQPQVLETNKVLIEMPAEYVEEGLVWTSSDETAILEDSEGRMVAMLMWGEAATHEHEIFSDSYGLGWRGTASVGMVIPVWDDQGKNIYAGKPASGTLSTDATGITVDEIVSWITLVDGARPAPAEIVDRHENASDYSKGHTPENASSSSSSQSQLEAHGQSVSVVPFYGVWIGAFSTMDNAQTFASEARGKGLQAEVYITTEWENLNPTTYYVVSIDHASTEQGAETILAKTQAAGYDNAYIKYTGNHK